MGERARWALRRHAAAIAGVSGHPCEPSPYSPVSRLFWSEFYLDLARVPELAGCPPAQRLMEAATFQERLRKLRQAPLVDYAAQMALKRQVLEALGRSFFAKPSPRRRAFEKFLREHRHAADYARFRAVQEQRGESWTQWPTRMRRGELRDADCRPSLRHYHLYVQWLAHEQMAQLSDQARRRSVALYLDMPLGTHRDGYDPWRYQQLFALDASGGAPPDPVFTQGQDWGFAPIHPQHSREQGHAYIRACLRHQLRHARMLRFDHVMGLHRLYWVPRGLRASQGAYVTYPAEEFYAMLSIESHRHRAVIIGENLGTVPAEVNRRLKCHGVAGMFVGNTRRALNRVPPCRGFRRGWSPVSTPTTCPRSPRFGKGSTSRIAGTWASSNAPTLRANTDCARGFAGRSSAGSVVAANSNAERLTPGTVYHALVGHLGGSNARWLLSNLEDLRLETAPQNTPGTSTERVNWRRKMRFGLEQMPEKRQVLETFLALCRARP